MVVTEGFNNVVLERDLIRIIKTQPVKLAAKVCNVGEIEINDGHIVLRKIRKENENEQR